MFKGLTARRLYKSFGVKGLMCLHFTCDRSFNDAVSDANIFFFNEVFIYVYEDRFRIPMARTVHILA
jgi:hypothetical protein